MSKITIVDLFNAGAHYGHRSRYWNPKMSNYIYGKSNDLHIIDLDHTLLRFHEAANYISKIAATSNKILFVGTKKAASNIIKEQAERCNMPYVNHRWLGGMLTNYKTVRESIKKLQELEENKANGLFDKMIKKEALKQERDLSKLQMSLGGFKDMVGLPDALFVIDVGFENIAIKEAKKLKIPVVGIVDTNNDPEVVDYPIPGNDDSRKSIELYVSSFAQIIIDAKQAANAMSQETNNKTVSIVASAEHNNDVKSGVEDATQTVNKSN